MKQEWCMETEVYAVGCAKDCLWLLIPVTSPEDLPQFVSPKKNNSSEQEKRLLLPRQQTLSCCFLETPSRMGRCGMSTMLCPTIGEIRRTGLPTQFQLLAIFYQCWHMQTVRGTYCGTVCIEDVSIESHSTLETRKGRRRAWDPFEWCQYEIPTWESRLTCIPTNKSTNR